MLKSSASTARVLNLAYVKENNGDKKSYKDKPFFLCSRLNEGIIIKHNLREYDKVCQSIKGSHATKLVIPFSASDLSLGAYTAFIEEEKFVKSLARLLGSELDDQVFIRDMSILKELAGMPSLDPYLMRERLSRLGYDIANCYFDISESDIAKLESVVAQDISRLVSLAFSDSAESTASCNKLAKLLLTNSSDKALNPLRETLNLSPAQHSEGMFGWKGFLYYKWLVGTQRSHYKSVAQQILRVRVHQMNQDDREYFDKTKKGVVRLFSESVENIDNALKAYDDAFNSLIENRNPAAFRHFILMAPEMFLNTGEHLASVNHITSFWRYQFPTGSAKGLDVEEAYALFLDFASCLKYEEGM